MTTSHAAADSVAILTYHALVDAEDGLEAWDPGARLYVFTLEEFARQLDHLADEGFTTISMADLAAWHAGDAALPERPIVISFDDGHASNATLATPALAQRYQQAIFFVTAGQVGWDGRVSWDQLRGMLAAGMAVGSHTLTHRMPSTLSSEELGHELAESRRVLAEQLAAPIGFVASPTGYDSRHFAKLAKETGYTAAVQGVIGRNRRSTDRFALRRFVLKRTHGHDLFCRLVDPADRTYVRLRRRQAARNFVRRLVGPRAYEALRRVLLRGEP
jgi:peptidoglycan/xylan/chitin deacetylase (PgdA/CDA1 family)